MSTDIRVNPPTLIGGLILLITGLILPTLKIDFQMFTEGYLIGGGATIENWFLITSLFSNILIPSYDASCGFMISMPTISIPGLLFILGGIIALIGSTNKRKGLKVVSIIFPIAGYAITFVLIGYLVNLAGQTAVGCGYVNYSFQVNPDFGFWIAIVGGVLCTIGLIINERFPTFVVSEKKKEQEQVQVVASNTSYQPHIHSRFPPEISLVMGIVGAIGIPVYVLSYQPLAFTEVTPYSIIYIVFIIIFALMTIQSIVAIVKKHK